MPFPTPWRLSAAGFSFCVFLLVDCKNVYQSPSNVI
nr:MAG TPA: hypothetical protein [Caudoviricetes sp.]